MREIALDTETTGFEPSEGHRMVEIGCVEMQHHVRTGRVFHCYLNPERDMPEQAFQVHGLSTEFLQDKPLFKDSADDFLAFIGEAPLVIHNAAFDMKFLNHELGLLGKPRLPDNRAIDTVQMARQKFPGSPANLDALCKRFQIDLSARTKHGALLDAELLADVYLELMGGRQDAFALDMPAMPISNHAVESQDYQQLLGDKREFPLSEKEQERHHRFIGDMKKPIWAEYQPQEQRDA